MKKIFLAIHEHYYAKFNEKDNVDKHNDNEKNKEEFNNILSEIDAKKRKKYENKKSDHAKKRLIRQTLENMFTRL